MHDITNVRMGGTAVRNVAMFSSAVGEAAAKNVVILTTQWDLINQEVAERRFLQLRNEPNFFANIVKHGATMEKSRKGDRYDNIIETIVKRYQARENGESNSLQLQKSFAKELQKADRSNGSNIDPSRDQ